MKSGFIEAKGLIEIKDNFTSDGIFLYKKHKTHLILLLLHYCGQAILDCKNKSIFFFLLIYGTSEIAFMQNQCVWKQN